MMCKRGGLLTDFTVGTNPDRENFPKRNRIVAGLADTTIVIESAPKGGAMITARLANDYNRDVLAIPGRVSDSMSEGCNLLVQRNQAQILNNPEDLPKLLGIREPSFAPGHQISTEIKLNMEEEVLLSLIREHEKISLDQISFNSEFDISQLAVILLNLELKGVIRALPGKHYRAV